MPWTEVSVEDDDLIPRGLRERILQIPGFLHMPAIRPQYVVEPEFGGQIAYAIAPTIVEHIHGEFTGPLHTGDERISVGENVEALPIGRQEDVDTGIAPHRLPSLNELAVGLGVSSAWS